MCEGATPNFAHAGLIANLPAPAIDLHDALA
jgi:hypothetical protein